MLNIGKIPPDILEEIVFSKISKSKIKRDDVIFRPKTGEDCSAVDIGNELCVLSCDPITGASEEIGYLAVQINCNDIFSAGAVPIGILVTILLPPNSSEYELEKIMKGLQKGVDELSIEILGGHTEVSDAVVKPLVSATVIGKTVNRNFISTGGAKEGQKLIMTKWAGLEGSTIIAHDKEKELLEKGISQEKIDFCKTFSNYLSIGKESAIATKWGATAMHDVTEGGVLGGAWEMADCSGLGVVIDKNKIPVKKETLEICNLYKIDYLKLISSGCMLISVNECDCENMISNLNGYGIDSTIIGEFIKGKSSILVNDELIPLSEPDTDEIYKI